jgi:hypothetical protein
MVAMSAKLEPTPQPCATVLSYEDEIRSVERGAVESGLTRAARVNAWMPTTSCSTG